MSEKEKIVQLLDQVPEYKLGYILAYVQWLTAYEDNDEQYCQKLYQDYLEDTSPDKDETFTLDECKKEWGLAWCIKYLLRRGQKSLLISFLLQKRRG